MGRSKIFCLYAKHQWTMGGKFSNKVTFGLTPPSTPQTGHSNYGCARCAIDIRIASLLWRNFLSYFKPHSIKINLLRHILPWHIKQGFTVFIWVTVVGDIMPTVSKIYFCYRRVPRRKKCETTKADSAKFIWDSLQFLYAHWDIMLFRTIVKFLFACDPNIQLWQVIVFKMNGFSLLHVIKKDQCVKKWTKTKLLLNIYEAVPVGSLYAVHVPYWISYISL